MEKNIEKFLHIVGVILTTIGDWVSDCIGFLSSLDFGLQTTPGFMPISEVTSYFNCGLSLAGGLCSTPVEDIYKNVLIAGPSGSGKSSTVIASSIYSLSKGDVSMVILDGGGVLAKLASGYLDSVGYKQYFIDFTEKSDAINFLKLCKDTSDMAKVAFLIMKNSGLDSRSSDPYWVASAESMICVFIEYLLHYDYDNCNLGKLAELIELFAAEQDEVLKLYAKVDTVLFRKFKALISTPEKTMLSTLSTVRQALKIFHTEPIQFSTNTTTIDLASFRNTRSVLFINTPLDCLNFYAPVSALVYEFLFKELMKEIPDTSQNGVVCLLDEMLTMRFQNLGSIVYPQCRKYRISMIGVVQDERMMEMNYTIPESHAIRTNSFIKIYLPGQPLETCKHLQEILGKVKVKDEETEREREEWVMTTSDIRMCKEAIIIYGSELPIKAKLEPYYENWKLSRLMQMPPYVRNTGTITHDTVTSFNGA